MAGQPRKYKTPEELEQAVDKYFEITPEARQTITGIALYLGFVSRQSFYDYEELEGYSYIIKKARLMVENSYEQTLRSKDIPATGSIFALKNMGWRDRQEVENTHDFKNKPTIILDFGEEDKGN